MSDIVFEITLDDGRTINAEPAPDQTYKLHAGRTVVLRPTDGDEDTSGHTASADVLVDVEGHAMTLHLPTYGDAAALRRALAMGAVTAALVAGSVGAMALAHEAPIGTGVDHPGVAAPAPAPEPGPGHFNPRVTQPE